MLLEANVENYWKFVTMTRHYLNKEKQMLKSSFYNIEGIDFDSLIDNIKTLPHSIISTVRCGSHTLHLLVIDSIDADNYF